MYWLRLASALLVGLSLPGPTRAEKQRPAAESLGNEPGGKPAVGTRPGKRRPHPGRLHLEARQPFYPIWRGRWRLLIGVSDRDALTIWRSEKGFDWHNYLEQLASHDLRYVRQNATAWTGLRAMQRYPAQFSEPRWAFARTGPGKAVDGRPRFDLTRLDDGYFQQRLIPFLREAERRAIIVELTLFDDCRHRRRFADSLYADPNNVNALGLRPGDDPHGDAALGNRRLLAVQQQYVARVLEATGPFGNVIYEVANETGGAWWIEYFVQFIHRRLPGALVSAGQQSSAYDPLTGRCDLVVKHRGAAGLYRSDQDVARHRRSLIALRRGGKPVLHNEFFLFANRSTGDPHFVRKMFWADFTGGGHANFYDFTWWRGTGPRADEGEPSRPPPPAILDAGKFLRKFVREAAVPLEKMAPHDELAASPGGAGVAPFVLAAPGQLYVVYLIQGGGVRLELPADSGPGTARWFNPREGTFSEPIQREARGKYEWTAPDKNDWTLLLKKRR